MRLLLLLLPIIRGDKRPRLRAFSDNVTVALLPRVGVMHWELWEHGSLLLLLLLLLLLRVRHSVVV
jgi:hypothetical protein